MYKLQTQKTKHVAYQSWGSVPVHLTVYWSRGHTDYVSTKVLEFIIETTWRIAIKGFKQTGGQSRNRIIKMINGNIKKIPLNVYIYMNTFWRLLILVGLLLLATFSNGNIVIVAKVIVSNIPRQKLLLLTATKLPQSIYYNFPYISSFSQGSENIKLAKNWQSLHIQDMLIF